MKKKFGFASIVIAFLGVMAFLAVNAARAQDPLEVDITVKEFKVEMSRKTLPVNTPIKFVVTNKGTIAHEVVLEKAGADDEPLEIVEGEESEIEDIMPGETKSAVWTFSEPGQYQLACHVPGHFEGGMLITFSAGSGINNFISQPLTWIIVGGIALLAVLFALLRGGMALPRTPAV
jgi:uncharacterized cupredoxin-like copper-binding protein